MKHASLKLFVCFLIALVAGFGCACSESQIAKAKKVGSAAQFVVTEASLAIPLGVAAGDFSEDQGKNLTETVAELTKVVGEYNEFVKDLKPNDRASPQRLAELTKKVADSLDRLNDQGILKIKNVRARERLGLALFVARTAAGALSLFLADAGYPAQGGGNET